MASFVKDKKRGHDDVSGVFGWIRVVSLEQAEVDYGVGVGAARVQLKEDRNRHANKEASFRFHRYPQTCNTQTHNITQVVKICKNTNLATLKLTRTRVLKRPPSDSISLE